MPTDYSINSEYKKVPHNNIVSAVKLLPTGNVVFKDGTRTMWSSKTANLWFGKAPYSLFLNHRGEIVVRDSNGYYIWQSANVLLNSTGPFTIKVEDKGELAVYAKNGELVWSSWG
ncbi:hypothetical protein CONCODRAFT_171009 [Conidiobolus coronatus NRRL 28638]|uniref:Bulb-type lectin domain-containing protein n=1 Tax=Conidiobolus coronatus (strain ATCC 28846 / CBS 209.66 / NRRL 28638) TaxID=796925 RepID=A0A137P518_CONC2|nr:hypothetical protein CONCODRAFT_171009 [Conidiobolus coronatus NRRL 28638]|eukprot:KXN70110.1 hypothetical protein CONCODRAFT_171009 [Conidiobolus coronatus NRRL 28638]